MNVITKLNFSESQKGWDCNRADRMEMELDDRDELRTRIEELEQGNADLLEQNKDLQERSINLKVLYIHVLVTTSD